MKNYHLKYCSFILLLKNESLHISPHCDYSFSFQIINLIFAATFVNDTSKSPEQRIDQSRTVNSETDSHPLE